jgi:hypothetical protein
VHELIVRQDVIDPVIVLGWDIQGFFQRRLDGKAELAKTLGGKRTFMNMDLGDWHDSSFAK